MKRIAILAVVAVGLAGLAALAVPLLVSPDLIKQRIADRISMATGRTVTLTGEPSLSIYPHLAVSVGGLTIANPKGMGDDPFAVADEVTTRLSLLPLLAGQMKIEAVELVRPRVHLVAETDGRTNWAMARNNASGAPAIADLALGRLTVADGTVVYDDAAAKRHEELTGVDLDLSWPAVAAGASGNGKMQWRGETIEFNGAVANPVELVDGRGSDIHFAVASTPLRVSFNGSMGDVESFDLEGDAAVSTPSLRKVVAWLGTPIGNGSILGPASITGRLSWHGADLSFAHATLGLDGNEAQGVAAVDFSGPRPSVRGTFAAAKLDLSPYFEAVRADLNANGPWPFAPTHLPVADLMNCDLRLSAHQVLIGALQLTGVGATGIIKNGAVTVTIGQALAYGGKLGATISAAMDGKSLSGHLKATVDGALVQTPLKDLLNVAALSGKANASIDIDGSGSTWGALAQSVTGNASIAVANGVVDGVDIKEIATRMVDPLADPMPLGQGSAPFDGLTGKLTIANGVLSTSGLALSGPGYAIDLSGRGSLITGTVEAQATLAVKTGAGATIPLTVMGTWRAPQIGPRQLTLDGKDAAQSRG